MPRRAVAAANPTGGHIWLVIAHVASWATVLIVLVFGLDQLERYVRASRVRQACTIEWLHLPQWLAHPNQAEFLAQRALEAGLTPTDSVSDSTLAERIGVRLSASPWVAEVRRVTLRSDGRILIDARWREPLAFVERDGKALLIDEHGNVLRDDQPLASIDRRAWYVIQGIAGPARPPGTALAGEDLRCGIDLVRYLMRAESAGALAWRGLIRAIDVSNHKLRRDRRAGETRIITTNADGPIYWGLPPGAEHGIEPGAQEKLNWLAAQHAAGALLAEHEPLDPRDPRRR